MPAANVDSKPDVSSTRENTKMFKSSLNKSEKNTAAVKRTKFQNGCNLPIKLFLSTHGFPLRAAQSLNTPKQQRKVCLDDPNATITHADRQVTFNSKVFTKDTCKVFFGFWSAPLCP